jgi:transcriptional regulator with XRE-family HTH domain
MSPRGTVPARHVPETTLNLHLLREARSRRHLTLQDVADQVGVSPAEIQRLETGKRHMTLEMLEACCRVLGLDPLQVFDPGFVTVPVIGVVDFRSNILPLPAGSPVTATVPPIVCDAHRLAAVRWDARNRFELLNGSLMVFYADVVGISPAAWNRRSVIRRNDGTQRTGWLYRRDGQTHINDVVGPVEFNVQIEWASPILGMINLSAFPTAATF